MESRINLLICWSLMSLSLLAQDANSWINFDQDYIKLQIVESGWYRVTAAELQAAGYPANTVAASQLQLFRKGQEVAITTQTNSGLSTLNYFEFYGEKIDGTGDAELYRQDAQPHTYYNLFTDTATYFLTWSNTSNHKRILNNTQNDNTGLTPKTSHFEVLHRLQVSSYAAGRFLGALNDYQLAEYDIGEGWTGPIVSKNAFQDFTFNLSNGQTTGVAPQIEIVAIGRNSLSHVVTVQGGPSSTSLFSVGQLTWDGYSTTRRTFDFPWAQVATNGDLTLRCTVTGVPGATDNASFSSIKITYPQLSNLTVGENKLLYYQPDGSSRYYLQLASANPASFTFYDVTNPYTVIRLPQNALSTRSDVVLPMGTTVKKVMAVATHRQVPRIKSHQFDEIDLAGKDYLIIAHPLLRKGSNGSDPVANYATYRSSMAGGSYQVVVADINQVYDQFNYGDPSTIAIRNLMKSAYTAGVTHALILGKGRTVNQNLFRKTWGDPANLATSEVFVPTYGIPGGDFPYSIGLDASRILIPAIAIGRVNVWQPNQVQAYLDKVIEMESVPFDQLWRKDLIQLSGGTSALELSQFATYIEDFKRFAEGDYLGGRAMNQGKKTSAPYEPIDISSEVNRGVGFITLFGHSSNTVTDVEIGKPSDPDFNYQNQGKYPLIIVNGCRAGEIFGDVISFGEDWISADNKGAIGFIAHSDQASSSNLRLYSNAIYNTAFNDTLFYAKTIGEVMQEAAVRYYQFSTSELSQTQIQGTLYQGDPGIVYFKPDKPDFHLLGDRIRATSITGDQLLAQQDSFLLHLPINNYGRTTLDSLRISVHRTFPGGETMTYTSEYYPPRYADTLTFYIRNPTELNSEGNNLLQISLDPDNDIAELREINNTASLEVFISSGSTQHVLPYDQAVVTEDTAVLIWQLTDPYEANREISLAYDTTATFSSPFAQNKVLFGSNLMIDTIALGILPDSTVVYWRTRFAAADTDEDTIWSTSSFTRVINGQSGWGQFSLDQFAKNELDQLVLDDQRLSVSFTQNIIPLELKILGKDSYNYDDLGIIVNNSNLLATINILDSVCFPNTFNALVFDRYTSQMKAVLPPPLPPPRDIDVYNTLVCGRLPQMIHNLNATNMYSERRIEELVGNLNPGDQVVFFNIDSIGYSAFDAGIIGALGEVGVDPAQLTGLVDGQPIVIIGAKGLPAGNATVIKSDGSGLPVTQQTIITNTEIIGTEKSGSFTTPIIGPVTSWNRLTANIDFKGSDYANLNLIGRAADGAETLLLNQVDLESEIDLNFIDAASYPFLKMNVILGDATDLTPPAIAAIAIAYTGTPEGILIPNQKATIELQEGEDIQTSFSIINVGNTGYSDSLDISFAFRNVTADRLIASDAKVGPIASGDTLIVPYTLSSVDLVGQNALTVRISGSDQELIRSNNQLIKSNFVSVKAESISPILDVTIDGRYILDGEIVSSNPVIRIGLKDENPYLIKEDTTGLEMSIKYPGTSSDFRRVAFSQSAVAWTPASSDTPFEVIYQPSLLEDGVYTLRVSAADESGNLAGEKPYEISFEVINQSTITHFYPYPNPFSTSCRFVFTVTGSVVPDNLLIQIMTISGRVVKNIDETELGPIHIGNNISDYVWDGTDDFGDQLANGVYLYKVTVKAQGQVLDHRATSADLAFKRGYGKLYILR